MAQSVEDREFPIWSLAEFGELRGSVAMVIAENEQQAASLLLQDPTFRKVNPEHKSDHRGLPDWEHMGDFLMWQHWDVVGRAIAGTPYVLTFVDGDRPQFSIAGIDQL